MKDKQSLQTLDKYFYTLCMTNIPLHTQKLHKQVLSFLTCVLLSNRKSPLWTIVKTESGTTLKKKEKKKKNSVTAMNEHN